MWDPDFFTSIPKDGLFYYLLSYLYILGASIPGKIILMLRRTLRYFSTVLIFRLIHIHVFVICRVIAYWVVLVLHIDGLVQERHNSIATHWSYVFLALTHQYVTWNTIYLTSSYHFRPSYSGLWTISWNGRSGVSPPTLPSVTMNLRWNTSRPFKRWSTTTILKMLTIQNPMSCYHLTMSLTQNLST